MSGGGKRDKDKYPYLPSELSDREIRNAVEKAGSVMGASRLLGVNAFTLGGEIRRRGIRVAKGVGGTKSRFDWVAIERDWRARAPATFAAVFARERGMNPSTFYQTAERRGFYSAPPGKGPEVIKHPFPKAVQETKKTITLSEMTAENRAKAAAAMDMIDARNEFSKMIRNERHVHAAAIDAARARIRAKFAEGVVA